MWQQFLHNLREYFEDLWWKFGLLLESRERDPQKRLEQLKRLRLELRRALKRTPWWVDGHLSLGMVELDLVASEKPTPRSVSTVRISADAVLKLMNRRSPFRKKNARQVLEAKYLLAMGFFRLGRYEDAVQIFEGVLALNNAAIMRKEAFFSGLEHAALASIVLDDKIAAESYLGRIPHNRLSTHGQQALELLSRERV